MHHTGQCSRWGLTNEKLSKQLFLILKYAFLLHLFQNCFLVVLQRHHTLHLNLSCEPIISRSLLFYCGLFCQDTYYISVLDLLCPKCRILHFSHSVSAYPFQAVFFKWWELCGIRILFSPSFLWVISFILVKLLFFLLFYEETALIDGTKESTPVQQETFKNLIQI